LGRAVDTELAKLGNKRLSISRAWRNGNSGKTSFWAGSCKPGREW